MKNIYVWNLDFRCTEAELRTKFEVYGQVDKITIVLGARPSNRQRTSDNA